MFDRDVLTFLIEESVMKKSLRGRIITKKIMALACMFTLTFSDFAFVGKAYGTALSNLLGNESKHENVIFDASFQDEKTIGKDFESDVNNDGLGIKFELDVEKAGYLKDAKIEILPKEGEKINFATETNQKGNEGNLAITNQRVAIFSVQENVEIPIECIVSAAATTSTVLAIGTRFEDQEKKFYVFMPENQMKYAIAVLKWTAKK